MKAPVDLLVGRPLLPSRQALEQPELDERSRHTPGLPGLAAPPEDEAPVSPPDVVLYWSSEEFDLAAERLPGRDLPGSHVEHRRRVEAFLRERVGRTPLVISGGSPSSSSSASRTSWTVDSDEQDRVRPARRGAARRDELASRTQRCVLVRVGAQAQEVLRCTGVRRWGFR